MPKASTLATSSPATVTALRDVLGVNEVLGTVNIYDDTTAGLAATSDGDYFSVPSGSSDEYLILYVRTNSTTATEIKRYPARDAIRKLAVKVGVDGSGSSVGSYGDTTPNTSTITTGFTYGLAAATTAPGYLDSFSVRVNAAGTGRIIVYQDQDDGTAEVIHVGDVLAVAAGLNTFTDPLAGVLLPTGSRPHWSIVTTGVPRYVAGGAGSSVVSGSSHALGASVTITPNSNTIAIAWTLMAASNALADRVSVLESQTVIPLAPTQTFIHTLFPGTSLPSGWFESGGWTVNESLIGPATPGWGKYARGGNYSALARRRFTARITAADDTGIWGACADYPTTGGAFAAVDGTAGMLRLYTWGGSTTAGTLVEEVALPAAIVAGRDYLLDVVKNYMSITVTVTDCLTLESATLTSVKAAGNPFFHGRGGIMQISGAAITVKWFDVRANYPEGVHTIIIGDSNTEGTLAALSNSPGSYARQFAALRAEGDVAVAGLAGDTPANYTAYRRTRDLLGFTSAKYAIYNLGTNGNDQAAWRTGVTQFIADCATLGAEPILCTYPPRAGFQTTLDAQNADVLGKYFGNIRYIDIAAAVTSGNDRVTWNTAYNGDGTHYNAAGHVRVLQQMRVDCPFLFA